MLHLVVGGIKVGSCGAAMKRQLSFLSDAGLWNERVLTKNVYKLHISAAVHWAHLNMAQSRLMSQYQSGSWMKVKVVKWCFKKWNEHIPMYHKQCRVMHKSNGLGPLNNLWKGLRIIACSRKQNKNKGSNDQFQCFYKRASVTSGSFSRKQLLYRETKTFIRIVKS